MSVSLAPETEASVRQRMEGIPIFRTLGFRDAHLGLGWFESTVPRDRRYDGIFECFHGGLLMTIADSAAAVAILTICGPGSQIATTDMNIRFLAPAQSEVRVYARVIKAGKTLVPVSVDLWDSKDQLVAISQVNYMRLNQDKL
jgi:uncharacterized protein (TIGR00369 family)